MKDIKFRAWDVDSSEMIYTEENNRVDFFFDFQNTLKLFLAKEEDFAEDRKAYLMQFIGKKDINKNEIYVGDILQYGDGMMWSRFEVIWNERYCQFELDCTRVSPNISNPSFDALDSMFLIGNIHENTELLTK